MPLTTLRMYYLRHVPAEIVLLNHISEILPEKLKKDIARLIPLVGLLTFKIKRVLANVVKSNLISDTMEGPHCFVKTIRPRALLIWHIQLANMKIVKRGLLLETLPRGQQNFVANMHRQSIGMLPTKLACIV